MAQLSSYDLNDLIMKLRTCTDDQIQSLLESRGRDTKQDMPRSTGCTNPIPILYAQPYPYTNGVNGYQSYANDQQFQESRYTAVENRQAVVADANRVDTSRLRHEPHGGYNQVLSYQRFEHIPPPQHGYRNETELLTFRQNDPPGFNPAHVAAFATSSAYDVSRNDERIYSESESHSWGNSPRNDSFHMLPGIDDFRTIFTIKSLPEYAIVLGSKDKSYNSLGASTIYRHLRGTCNTELSTVYERLLSHFESEGRKNCDTRFPRNRDQLLFVHVRDVDRFDFRKLETKFVPIVDRETRDKAVLVDIRTNGRRSHVEILQTTIDQKMRDLESAIPAPEASKCEVFLNHLNAIKGAIANRVLDDTTIDQHKASIDMMWELYFTNDRPVKKRGRPKMATCVRNTDQGMQARFTLSIQTSKKSKVKLDAKPNDTIGNIKDKLFEKEGIPPNNMILVFRREELSDHRTLSHYNIDKKSVLDLVELAKSKNTEQDCVLVNNQSSPRETALSTSVVGRSSNSIVEANEAKRSFPCDEVDCVLLESFKSSLSYKSIISGEISTRSIDPDGIYLDYSANPVRRCQSIIDDDDLSSSMKSMDLMGDF